MKPSRREIEADIQNNHAQRSPCVLVLDTSASMAEYGRIDRLNDALKEFEQIVKSTETLRQRVAILVVGFGSEADYLGGYWMSADEFQAPMLEAGGMTAMGEAMKLAHHAVEEFRKELDKAGITYTRPWIFLLSDGGPNDENWEAAADESRRACEAKRADVWPIAIPPDADGTALRRFARKDMKVYSLGADADFRRFFHWLGKTLTAVSMSGPGDKLQVQAPGDMVDLEV
ncbi:MAG: VWA domain-containing protein [Bryobacteraceae bacterium]|nr:VWA domain-containing protein [Bryobacteraceae bacterium]